MGAVGVTESYFQANSGYNNTSRLATPWVLTNFIEAQSEKDQQGTGIGLGANTGYSNADEVALVSGGTTVAKAVTTGFNPGGHQTQTLGTSGTGEWLSVHAVTFSGQASTALYADLAENYKADSEYETGVKKPSIKLSRFGTLRPSGPNTDSICSLVNRPESSACANIL